MPRPKKWRRVSSIPTQKVFGPLGRQEEAEVVIMSVEEYESLKLMDLEGLDQNACADKMLVARSTFQRIYSQAKNKLVDCLVNNKIIKVEGGNYTLKVCQIQCSNCGHEWEQKYEEIDKDIICPNCGIKTNVDCINNNEIDLCRKCHRHRHRHGR